jgi:hypothetical protein
MLSNGVYVIQMCLPWDPIIQIGFLSRIIYFSFDNSHLNAVLCAYVLVACYSIFVWHIKLRKF